MARRTWSMQNAKNRFSEVVEAAQSEPQTVTKHGKPVVVIITTEEYERLRKLEQLRSPSFVELLLAVPRGDLEFGRLAEDAGDTEF